VFTLVVAGGDLILSPRVVAAVHAADYVIAADCGARHLSVLGRAADLVVGDFDSYHPAAGEGYDIMSFPVQKDQTDTHLAVRIAKQRGADRITVLAALRGDRSDHAAANLLLVGAQEFRSVDLRLVDGKEEIRAVRDEASVDGRPGDLVTLLAISRAVRGVTTSGLTYPLRGETLLRGDSRGVSNGMEGTRATVGLHTGVMLLIHRLGSDPNRLR